MGDHAVYVMFNNSECSGIVAEIQMVHPRFLDIRSKFGAHDSYDAVRFAAEMRKCVVGSEQPGLPDSQRIGSLSRSASVRATVSSAHRRNSHMASRGSLQTAGLVAAAKTINS